MAAADPQAAAAAAAIDDPSFLGHIDEDLSEGEGGPAGVPDSSGRRAAFVGGAASIFAPTNPGVPPPEHLLIVSAGTPCSANVHGLRMLGDDMHVPPDLLNSLLVALEGDDTTSVEDFGFLTPDELEAACDSMVNVAGAPINSIVRCKIRKLHFRACQLASLPLEKAPVHVAPKPKVKVAQPKKRKFQDILEQGDDATFEIISKKESRAYRKHYEKITGYEPPDHCRPTTEQISALRAKIADEEAPFADFGIFGPFGKKAAKLRKFDVQKLVGDQVITKYITGPSTYDEWLGSWKVYRTTLIALGAVSSGALELYSEGIRILTTLYPHAWGEILLADEEMRYENWDRMLETFEDSDVPIPGFNPARPWDFIVAASAFNLGLKGTEAGWWNMNLVAGLNSPQSAQSITSSLTGRPQAGRAASSSQPHPRRDDKGVKGDTRKGGGKGKEALCHKWNSAISCHRFRCPLNYVHKCSSCGSTEHGATSCSLVKPISHDRRGNRGKKANKK
jgi:hypothetical protein